MSFPAEKHKRSICGSSIRESGFHYSAWYEIKGEFQHIFCHIRQMYSIMQKQNGDYMASREVVNLHSCLDADFYFPITEAEGK